MSSCDKHHHGNASLNLFTSVAPIIRSAIGIGQYRALTGISAVYLDLACRYLVLKREL